MNENIILKVISWILIIIGFFIGIIFLDKLHDYGTTAFVNGIMSAFGVSLYTSGIWIMSNTFRGELK